MLVQIQHGFFTSVTTCLVFLSCLGYSPSRGSPTSLLIFRFDRRLKTFRLRLESSPSIHSYLVESSSLTIHFIPRTKGDPWIWVSSLLKFVELGVRLVLLPLHPPGGFSGHPSLVVHARRVSGEAVEMFAVLWRQPRLPPALPARHHVEVFNHRLACTCYALEIEVIVWENLFTVRSMMNIEVLLTNCGP